MSIYTDKTIGLSAPEPSQRDRVHVAVWDIGADADADLPRLGTAAFTATEARAFAQKLLKAAEIAESRWHHDDPELNSPRRTPL